MWTHKTLSSWGYDHVSFFPLPVSSRKGLSLGGIGLSSICFPSHSRQANSPTDIVLLAYCGTCCMQRLSRERLPLSSDQLGYFVTGKNSNTRLRHTLCLGQWNAAIGKQMSMKKIEGGDMRGLYSTLQWFTLYAICMFTFASLQTKQWLYLMK